MLKTKLPYQAARTKYIGFTLIELMIALFLSVIVLMLLAKIYLASFQVQHSLNELHYTANKIVHELTAEVKQAGYIGCARLTADFPIYPRGILTPKNQLEIEDNEMIVRYTDFSAGVIVKNIQIGSVYASSEKIFKAGDTLMMSDCKKAEVFRVKTVRNIGHMQEIIPFTALHYQFAQYAEIGKFMINKQSKTVKEANRHQFTKENNLLHVYLEYSLNGIKKPWHLYFNT